MTRGGHLVTVSALPARLEHRELGAPPTMIGLRARRPFVRGFACLLLGGPAVDRHRRGCSLLAATPSRCICALYTCDRRLRRPHRQHTDNRHDHRRQRTVRVADHCRRIFRPT